jgi:hypothetical protein
MSVAVASAAGEPSRRASVNTRPVWCFLFSVGDWAIAGSSFETDIDPAGPRRRMERHEARAVSAGHFASSSAFSFRLRLGVLRGGGCSSCSGESSRSTDEGAAVDANHFEPAIPD